MGRHRAPSRRSHPAAQRAQHRAHDHDGCGIGVSVISLAMLVFAGCTLVSARAAAIVAAISLLIVAAWVRRYASGRNRPVAGNI